MGLPAALKAHAARDLAVAAHHYKRAIDQKSYKPVLFQNYGALLRELGREAEARSIYELGLKNYPDDMSIKRNYANLLREMDISLSLEVLFDLLHYRFENHFNELNDKDFLPIIQVLHSLRCHSLAYQISLEAILFVGLSAGLAVECLKSFAYYDRPALSSTSNARQQLEHLFSSKLESFSSLQKAEYLYALSWMYFQDKSLDLAIKYLHEARHTVTAADNLQPSEIKQVNLLNDLTSWNASSILLNSQNFELGWKLFDHGLRVAAKGPQAWQRALPKIFTGDQVPLWRGEDLSSKSLLLLEEQAIGDVMQFLSLLPVLLREAKHICLLLNDRLYPIYKRSFFEYIELGVLSILSFAHVGRQALDPSAFDYQSPLGSICQYRFTHPSSYAPSTPVLNVDFEVSSKLKSTYLSVKSSYRSTRLIGVSWRGGGTSSRIKQKSIDPIQFYELLSRIPNTTFLDLQYGNTQSEIAAWQAKGINIVSDQQFDPVKNMDKWLLQVQACDAVISVANTTIHGSGGLNIPTLCLLSQNFDWRWLMDPSIDQSYWYPSVRIARESDLDGWNSTFSQAIQWCHDGCPPGGSKPYEV